MSSKTLGRLSHSEMMLATRLSISGIAVFGAACAKLTVAGNTASANKARDLILVHAEAVFRWRHVKLISRRLEPHSSISPVESVFISSPIQPCDYVPIRPDGIE